MVPQWIWYVEPTDNLEQRQLARWLGPCSTVRSRMASWVLDSNSQDKVQTSIFPVSHDDLNNDEIRHKMKAFQDELDGKLKSQADPLPPDEMSDFKGHRFEHYEDEKNPAQEVSEADHFSHEIYDKYISARLMLPQGDSMAKATVIG